MDSATDAPWEKCARRAVPLVAEDLLALSSEAPPHGIELDPPPPSELDLRDYLRVVWGGKWVILGIALLVTTAAVGAFVGAALVVAPALWILRAAVVPAKA